MKIKKCKTCKADKNVEDFWRSSNTKDGRQTNCKKCSSEKVAEWKANNKEKYLESRRAYQQTDSYKRSAKRSEVKYKYGLTLEEYEKLLSLGCSVCGDNGNIVLDHCHTSNSVRQPLCQSCNKALGFAYDSPERLRALAKYLERHSAA